MNSMWSTVRSIAPLVLVSLAACASGKPTPATAPDPTAAAPRVAGVVVDSSAAGVAGPSVMQGSTAAPKRSRDRATLTRDEIRETQYSNLYDVIATLRGNWLRSRTAETVQGRSSTVQVYLDTQRLSGVEELRNMMSANIESVRYFDSLAASARWGMDHGAGAILVTTAKR
jgi:hypothetical protein